MQSLLNVPAEVVLANINAAVAKAAVKDIGGKVLAIFFPILAFVDLVLSIAWQICIIFQQAFLQ